MRPYIFRGKREEDGKWVIGTGIDTFGGTFILNAYERETDATDCDDYRVNPLTVGQYTGLKDKNGKMIFDGDIVRYGDTIHEVVFEQRNGTAYFGLVYSMIETLPFGHYQDLNQIEVIGNIHDNSELLKGE